jgi:molybdate transport system substrate-binding protein
VIAQSVAQTFQFVASGNAEVGFVAWSQVLASSAATAGSYWLVPSELHAPIHQDAVLLKTGEGNPAAAAFMEYLKSEEARGLIRSLGYEI